MERAAHFHFSLGVTRFDKYLGRTTESCSVNFLLTVRTALLTCARVDAPAQARSLARSITWARSTYSDELFTAVDVRLWGCRVRNDAIDPKLPS